MELCKVQIVLQDDRVLHDRLVTATPDSIAQNGAIAATGDGLVPSESNDLRSNVQGLLKVFENVHLTKTSSACLAQVTKLDTTITNQHPIFVLIPVTSESPSPKKHISRVSTDLNPIPQGSIPKEPVIGEHGLELIKQISEDQHYSKLVVPIAVVHDDKNLESDTIVKFLEAGAGDIITNINEQRLLGLATVATKAYIEAKKTRPAFLALKKQRKISWVGMQEDKPYAHLREEMVSKLMQNICQPQTDVIVSPAASSPYTITEERTAFVKDIIGQWAFPAHDLNYDELTEAAVLMLKHALTMPELERWRMTDDEIRRFMLDCRAAYNDFVLYHNFRHIVDVLQAVFSFLIAIGALPKYPFDAAKKNEVQSPIATLVRPFDAFVLLITAIGHDVGHPGVNNAFLVSIKAPLAQLYNDNSVLEAFHCAAYSQILRRYWPTVYEDVKIRQLLIKSILATDMQLHFKYMADLGNLQEKLAHNKGIDGWNDKILDDYRNLACGLLIKCADISNLARPFKIAAKWTDILQLEFACQGEMERTVGIETTLFGGPPELGNVTKLANSQIGFMNIFALPLFESVTDILPPMKFTVNQIKSNQEVWKQRIEEEKTKEAASPSKKPSPTSEGWQSPRSASPQRTTFSNTEANSHPEGIPASGSIPRGSPSPPLNTSQGTPETRTTIPSNSGVQSTSGARSPTSLTSGSSGRTMNFSAPTSIALRNDLAPAVQSHENENADSHGPLLHALSTEDLGGVVVQSRASTINGWSHAANKSVVESETPVTFRASNGNFSRPMSQRHSATTRSSAPSGAPTVASTFNATSPTETQATSLFERGSESDLSGEYQRPSSGYSGAMRGGSGNSSGYSSYSRGANGYVVQPTPSLYYTKNANGLVVESTATTPRNTTEKTLKSKRSRSRFFPPSWFSKKNKSGEITPNEQKR